MRPYCYIVNKSGTIEVPVTPRRWTICVTNTTGVCSCSKTDSPTYMDIVEDCGPHIIELLDTEDGVG